MMAPIMALTLATLVPLFEKPVHEERVDDKDHADERFATDGRPNAHGRGRTRNCRRARDGDGGHDRDHVPFRLKSDVTCISNYKVQFYWFVAVDRLRRLTI